MMVQNRCKYRLNALFGHREGGNRTDLRRFEKLWRDAAYITLNQVVYVPLSITTDVTHGTYLLGGETYLIVE